MLKDVNKYLNKYKLKTDDDLTISIGKENNFKDKIYLLSAWIFENSKINHKTRLKIHLWIIKFAKQNRCKFTIAHNLTLTSRIYYGLNDISKSIESALKAINIWVDLKDEKLKNDGIIHNYINLISNYADIGLIDYSKNYINKAKKIIDENLDISTISKIRFYLMVGNLNYSQNNLNESEKSYLNALKHAKTSNNLIYSIPCNIGICKILISRKEINKAIKLCENTLKKCQKIDDIVYKESLYSILGESFEINQKFNQAIEYFHKSHELQFKYSIIQNLGKSLLNIGNIYIKTYDYKNAINTYKKIIDLEKYNINLDVINSNYKNLSFCYTKIKEYKKSNFYYKKYIKSLEKIYLKKEKCYKQNTNKIINSYNDSIKSLLKEKNSLELMNLDEYKKLNIISGSLLSASFNDFLSNLIKNIKKGINQNDLIIEIKNKLLECNSWKDYINIYENINPSFNSILRKYTNNKITSLELRICSLIKLGFDKYEISGIIGISIRGVEQHRYRIKKKFNQNIDSLDIFIHTN